MIPKTKIVCTLGPAVLSFEKIQALIEAGMSVARLNFSHGTHDEHQQNIEWVKKAREKLGRPVAILMDTQGPEIRIGKVPGDALAVKVGQKLQIGDGGLPFESPELLAALSIDQKVLFDDGYLIAHVVESGNRHIIVEMENAGTLKSGKKMNTPGARLPIPAMTPDDVADLKFGCKEGVDYVAASFIRSAHHVLSIKEVLAAEGRPHIPVIAKIECIEGVENLDPILQVADGVMIARGDLGVELDLALVPKLQKLMIRKCFQACKPSITATQMLESMISNPRPTRAEVSDVANAIYDSTSCIMLSGETAVGKYPIETVARMCSIAKEAEADFNYRSFFEQHSQRDYHDLSSAVAMAAVKTAYGVNAKAIFAPTTSGTTARLVSRLRPDMPIVAITTSKETYHQLALNWGVIPLFIESCHGTKEAIDAATQFALEQGLISFGDVVVVTAGVPFGKRGTTNVMMIEAIGEVLVRGHKGSGPQISGKIAIVLTPERGDTARTQGKIVLLTHCDNSYLQILKGAAGVILQNSIGDGSSETFATLVAKSLNIPVMCRADGAISILNEGEEVTLDPQRGIVYRGSVR